MAETEAPEAPTDQQVVDALRAALENVDLSQTTGSRDGLLAEPQLLAITA